ncbi:UNVERIFIED_CONTAM: hypothetical protein GTU68_005921, partial [Idotea baltica]|nr:hypothetical protein [Idotea baltica]
ALPNIERIYAQAGSASDEERSIHRCPFCPYKSGYKSSVDTHLKYKHTKEKPFSCNVCNYRSAQKIDMTRHLRIHTGEKPYECPHCHAKFSQKTSLSAHLNKTKKPCYEK